MTRSDVTESSAERHQKSNSHTKETSRGCLVRVGTPNKPQIQYQRVEIDNKTLRRRKICSRQAAGGSTNSRRTRNFISLCLALISIWRGRYKNKEKKRWMIRAIKVVLLPANLRRRRHGTVLRARFLGCFQILRNKRSSRRSRGRAICRRWYTCRGSSGSGAS